MKLYLTSGYWRGALNIGGLRLCKDGTGVKAALKHLHSLEAKPAWRPNAFEDFLDRGFFRVYELEVGVNQAPKLIRGNDLKDLIAQTIY